ncbi:MAG: TIGR03792 family protein [Prochlorothrix sp.]
MVIEYLTFQVAPADQATFLHWDDRLWTPVLSQQPGYQGKEIWRDRETPHQIHIVIRWQSWEQWQNIDPDLLQATEQAFQDALQAADCPYQFRGCQGLELLPIHC